MESQNFQPTLLKFTAKPGAWERQLQRKCNNPLFADCHTISQIDVDAAQRKDQQERGEFQAALEKLLHQATTLQSKEEGSVILEMRATVDKLYEQCAGLGGDFSLQKEGLKKLSTLIMESICASNPDDPKALRELEEEHQARQVHFATMEHSVVSHLLRPESPVGESEIVATLLSEDETDLEVAMSLFTEEQQKTLIEVAHVLINQLENTGCTMPILRSRLKIMEQSLQMWQ